MKALDLIKKVLKDFPNIKIKEIDLVEHPDMAVKYGVMTSPAIIINEAVAFVGVPNEKKFRKKLEEES